MDFSSLLGGGGGGSKEFGRSEAHTNIYGRDSGGGSASEWLPWLAVGGAVVVVALLIVFAFKK